MKANGMVWILSLTITAAIAQPVITQQPADQTVTNGGTAIFSVAVSGAGPFNYRWLFNGTNLPLIITTVAGNGSSGFGGDGGLATNALLNLPYGVEIDPVANLFIADSGNQVVRKIKNGIITTVAGNGTVGYSGDGGAATNAKLHGPYDLAIDNSGSLYISDQQNNCIRKVSNGIIARVAGSTISGYSGDGGLAINAKLDWPEGISLNSAGTLFIADTPNHRVRQLSTNGLIATFAGNGNSNESGDGGAATNAALLYPTSVAVDCMGNLFIADSGGYVRKVDTNGVITTVAGILNDAGYSGDGGAATNALLNSPLGVAVDSVGNLFIADWGNQRIRRVDVNGLITTFAGNGNVGFSGDGSVATNAMLHFPMGMAVDNGGNLYIADSWNNRIRRVGPSPYLPALTLNTISDASAGIYSVVITSSSGSVTSRIASLTVTLPPPRPAFAIAILTNGFVVAINLTNSGFGYTNTPLVRIIGGGGSGAQAVAVVSNGVVVAINVLNAGSGYTSAPQVVIEPPFILNPVLGIAPMSFLAFSNLTMGGSYQLQRAVAWYWTNQPVSFTATDVLYTQMVAGVAGSGAYRLALNPAPTQAFATPEVVNGFVVGAIVTSGGSGYVTSPAVKILGGGGTNATALAQISGGVVTNIFMTNAGFGYTNTPSIRIGQPPAAAVSPTVLPVMRVDSASLAPYDNYQIQFKPAIGGTWVNWNGGLFSPTDVTNSQFLFITNDVGFFRLLFVP
jgi:sugar lactone lactonase YvrE